MTDSLRIQHGGSHYKGLAIQPIQFAMANRYDAGAFSVLKYVTRHRAKNGREDLLKGRHFVELRRDIRREEPHCAGFPAIDVIPIEDYIASNGIDPADASILTDLHVWATARINVNDATAASHLIQKIDLLIHQCYPKE